MIHGTSFQNLLFVTPQSYYSENNCLTTAISCYKNCFSTAAYIPLQAYRGVGSRSSRTRLRNSSCRGEFAAQINRGAEVWPSANGSIVSGGTVSPLGPSPSPPPRCIPGICKVMCRGGFCTTKCFPAGDRGQGTS